MRIRVPHLIRLASLLVVVLSLIVAGRLSTVQAAQSAPSCVVYTDGGKVGITPILLDPRSGQRSAAARDYFATYEYRAEKIDYSPTGRAFVMWVGTYVAQRSWLFIGVPGSDKMRRVTEVYEGAGGWSPDGNSYAYIDNDHRDHLTIIDSAGNQKRVLPVAPEATQRPMRFAGWSGDSRYLGVMTLGNGHTAAYYFMSVDTLQFPLKSIEGQYDPYFLASGLSWSPQGNRLAYLDTNDPAHLMVASPERGIEQQVDIPASEEDFVTLPIGWSPDGHYLMLHIGTADDAHKNRNSSWDYWTSVIFGMDGKVRGSIRGTNLYDPIYERPQGWWTSDGSAWIFRQQSYASDITGADDRLIRYQIERDATSTIVERVNGNPLPSDGTWIAIPVWVEGSANIALIRRDGTQQRMIDQDFSAISDMRWLEDQRSLFYIGRREKLFTAGVVEAETGESLFQIDGLTEDVIVNQRESSLDRHPLYLSHSAQGLVLKAGEPRKQSLYLISLANKQSQHMFTEGYDIGDVFWSADDSAIALIRYDRVVERDVLHIFAADGSTAQGFVLDGQNEILLGWTWCP